MKIIQLSIKMIKTNQKRNMHKSKYKKTCTYLQLACRLIPLPYVEHRMRLGTTVNGNELGLLKTLSKESGSSSITPGRINIFRFTSESSDLQSLFFPKNILILFF